MISGSPGELEPVFQAMLAKATRLCEANFGMLFRYDGSVFHAIALQDVTPEQASIFGETRRARTRETPLVGFCKRSNPSISSTSRRSRPMRKVSHHVLHSWKSLGLAHFLPYQCSRMMNCRASADLQHDIIRPRTPSGTNTWRGTMPIGASTSGAMRFALLVPRTVRIASAQVCPPVIMKLSPTPNNARPSSRMATETEGRLRVLNEIR